MALPPDFPADESLRESSSEKLMPVAESERLALQDVLVKGGVL